MSLRLLVRHAVHDLVDRVLVGRTDGVALSEAGRREAAALARRLGRLAITRVQSSPQQRAIETAAAVSRTSGVPVEICAALDEIDFGAWAGRTFSELAHDPGWRRWNAARAEARTAGGESMADAQSRIVRHLEDMDEADPRGRIVMVTHAEMIRVAVLHEYGLPIEAWSRIEVPPASVTVIRRRAGGPSPGFSWEAA